MNRLFTTAVTLALLLAVRHAEGETLDGKLHHLRSGKTREWSEFPVSAEGDRLELSFQAAKNSAPATLLLRQRDVKFGLGPHDAHSSTAATRRGLKDDREPNLARLR